jgi:PadR family transcriptional regulator, regulatory protein PadR
MYRMTAEVERQAQLLRGTLDMCLLALLHQQPSHAYELTTRLDDHGLPGVGYGTLYPLVTRLRRLGLVEEHTEPSPAGPPRKVFRPSAGGRAALAQWSSQWLATSTAIHRLLTDAGVLPALAQEKP